MGTGVNQWDTGSPNVWSESQGPSFSVAETLEDISSALQVGVIGSSGVSISESLDDVSALANFTEGNPEANISVNVTLDGAAAAAMFTNDADISVLETLSVTGSAEFDAATEFAASSALDDVTASASFQIETNVSVSETLDEISAALIIEVAEANISVNETLELSAALDITVTRNAIGEYYLLDMDAVQGGDGSISGGAMVTFPVGGTNRYRFRVARKNRDTGELEAVDISGATSVQAFLVIRDCPELFLEDACLEFYDTNSDWENGLVTGAFDDAETLTITRLGVADLVIKVIKNGEPEYFFNDKVANLVGVPG